MTAPLWDVTISGHTDFVVLRCRHCLASVTVDRDPGLQPVLGRFLRRHRHPADTLAGPRSGRLPV